MNKKYIDAEFVSHVVVNNDCATKPPPIKVHLFTTGDIISVVITSAVWGFVLGAALLLI